MSGVTVGSVAAVVGATAAVAGGVGSYLQGQKQQKAMETANTQAKSSSDQQATLAEQAINKADAKQPATPAAAIASNKQASNTTSDTLLTGPMGVDPSTLTLGKSTLLGA